MVKKLSFEYYGMYLWRHFEFLLALQHLLLLKACLQRFEHLMVWAGDVKLPHMTVGLQAFQKIRHLIARHVNLHMAARSGQLQPHAVIGRLFPQIEN